MGQVQLPAGLVPPLCQEKCQESCKDSSLRGEAVFSVNEDSVFIKPVDGGSQIQGVETRRQSPRHLGLTPIKESSADALQPMQPFVPEPYPYLSVMPPPLPEMETPAPQYGMPSPEPISQVVDSTSSLRPSVLPNEAGAWRLPFLVKAITGINFPLGIEVCPDDHTHGLTIDVIYSPGIVDDWNREHTDDWKVYVGDVITYIDGSGGSANDLAEQLCSIQRSPVSVIMHLQIESLPRRGFDVELRPQAERRTPVGLLVVDGNTPNSVIVESVASDGLIVDWNFAHAGATAVRVGDRIVAINGQIKSAAEIMQFLQLLSASGKVATLRIEPDEAYNLR